MIFSIAMSVLGTLLVLAGLAGCIVPALPGPPIAFAALLLISWAGAWELYQVWLLVLMGVLAAAAAVLDNVLPALTSRRSGAGKAGVWGSVIGMLLGTVFFPPFGTIIGAFAGALAGELLVKREDSRPLKAALGVFSGTLMAITVKLAVTGTIGVLFVRGLVRLFS